MLEILNIKFQHPQKDPIKFLINYLKNFINLNINYEKVFKNMN